MGRGCLVKLTDAVLFLWFIVFAVVVLLFDSQAALPLDYYPKPLLDLRFRYATEYSHYLILDNPPFFVALVWAELFLLWPLSIASIFALVSAKSWYQITTLIYGVSWFTSLVAIVGDLWHSGMASEKLLMMYVPFVGLAVLASLRGLLPSPTSTISASEQDKGLISIS